MASERLAQVNVARALWPLDDPRMASFTSRIGEINGIAEGSPGFVWRYQGDFLPGGDPAMLFNLSVWESLDALREFLYRTAHVELFRGRRDWFPPAERPAVACWMIPGDVLPSPEEAIERLRRLREDGPTAETFDLRGRP